MPISVALDRCPDQRARRRLGSLRRAALAVSPVLIIVLSVGADGVHLLPQAVAIAALLVWFIWRDSGKDLQASYLERLY